VLNLLEIELKEFIEQILELLCNMPEATGRNIEFLPENTAVKVLGDEDKLKQVLINIVRNASEAIAAGETVKIQLENRLDSNQVCLKIHNGGDPIPPEILSKLTEPFYTTKSTGTGLGLAIVKRIVDAHGGELLIQSSPDTGTIVSVLLPLAL
jgi:signal transduction histidine kinase